MTEKQLEKQTAHIKAEREKHETRVANSIKILEEMKNRLKKKNENKP